MEALGVILIIVGVAVIVITYTGSTQAVIDVLLGSKS